MSARVSLAAAAALACCALAAPTALAADQVYWPNGSTNSFSFANVAGGGGDLSIVPGPGVNIDAPTGVAIDPVTGRLYWGNYSDGERIAFANFDGSGAGNLNTAGASGVPDDGYAWGIAIDPVGRRVFWANEQTTPEHISFANLDGSGGGDINTGTATVNGLEGVAVDPAAGRVYWANYSANKISFANLDGSGGQDLNTGAATVSNPTGVAVDPGAGRVYWPNSSGSIGFAQADGSGGGDLNTTGVTIADPIGPAIDAAAGRIYWAEGGNTIEFANLDGSGGAELPTPESTLADPSYLLLLEKPIAAAVPSVSGRRATGSTLMCGQGSWAPDVVGSFLYRSPFSFAYQWTRDGTDIPGATASSFKAITRGTYACRVSATNPAGSAAQTSAPVKVLPAFGRRTRVTLSLAGRASASGPVAVVVGNANDFAVTGRLSAQTAGRVTVARKVRVKLKGRAFRVRAKGKKAVKLTLPRAMRGVLSRQGAVRLRLTARVKDPAGTRRVVRSTLRVRVR